MTRSIAARLGLAFLVTLAALLMMSALAVSTFARLFESSTLIQAHHLRETSLFEDIRTLVTDAVGQDRAYILSPNDVYDEAFEADIDEINRLFEEYTALHRTVAITPEEVVGITRLRQAVRRLAGVHDQVQELVVEGQIAAARRLSEQRGRAVAAEAVSLVRSLVQVERTETDELMATVRADAGRAQRYMFLLALLAAAVSGAVALSLIRSVTVPVQRLVAVTRRVDRGHLDIRSQLSGRDEIGELAQSFDRMVDRLAVAFAEQERFLGDISHELRTPITIIRGHLEVLQRGARTHAQVERAIATSVGELERMARLVNDLLLLVRASGGQSLRLEHLPLREFLPEVLAKAAAFGPHLWRLGPVAHVSVPADRDRLTQALLNLLRNAAEHTAPGGVIVLAAAPGDGVVRISVTDDGEGIAPEFLPHIFERFRRGERASARFGWGLGLSIVQAIAEAHGGAVEVQSRPGSGSTFTVVLPMAPRLDAEVPAAAPPPA